MSKPFKVELNESEALFLLLALKSYGNIVRLAQGHMPEPPPEYLKADDINTYLTAALFKHYQSAQKIIDKVKEASAIYTCSVTEGSIEKSLFTAALGFGAVAAGMDTDDPSQVILALADYIGKTKSGANKKAIAPDDATGQVINKLLEKTDNMRKVQGGDFGDLLSDLKSAFEAKYNVKLGTKNEVIDSEPTAYTKSAHELLDSVIAGNESKKPQTKPTNFPTQADIEKLLGTIGVKLVGLKILDSKEPEIPLGSDTPSAKKDEISEEIERLKKENEEKDDNTHQG